MAQPNMLKGSNRNRSGYTGALPWRPRDPVLSFRSWIARLAEDHGPFQQAIPFHLCIDQQMDITVPSHTARLLASSVSARILGGRHAIARPSLHELVKIWPDCFMRSS